MSASIEIHVRSRWDAIALLRQLDRCGPYLVQVAPERWLVRFDVPGRHGVGLPRALAAIDESLAGRRIADAVVRVDGRVRAPRQEDGDGVGPPLGGERPVLVSRR